MPIRSRTFENSASRGRLELFYQDANGNPPVVSSSHESTVSSTLHTMNDEQHPGWFAMDRRNRRSPHVSYMFLRKNTFRAGGGIWQLNHIDGKTKMWTSGQGSVTLWREGYYSAQYPWTTPNVDSQVAAAIAASKTKAIVNIDTTPFSFLEDLAEYRATLRLVGNPLGAAKRLANHYESVLKGAKKSGLDHTRAHTQAWLEVRHGFGPVIRSLANGFTLASTRRVKFNPYRKSTGRVEVLTNFNGILNAERSGDYGYFRYQQELKHILTSGVYYEVSNPIDSFGDYAGLRLKDIPVTVWAVMPASFVVDYFYRVSSLIEATQKLADPTIKILGGWTSHREELTREREFTGETLYHPPTWTPTYKGDVVTTRETSHVRYPWTPDFTDVSPGVQLNLPDSFPKYIDTLGVVLSKLRR